MGYYSEGEPLTPKLKAEIWFTMGLFQLALISVIGLLLDYFGVFFLSKYWRGFFFLLGYLSPAFLLGYYSPWGLDAIDKEAGDTSKSLYLLAGLGASLFLNSNDRPLPFNCLMVVGSCLLVYVLSGYLRYNDT